MAVLLGLSFARLMNALWTQRARMSDPEAIKAANIIQAGFRVYRHNKRCRAMNTLRGWCKELVAIVKTQVWCREGID